MSLEVSEHNEGVVIRKSSAHRHLLQVLSVHREINAAIRVHDVNRAERPAIHLQRFEVILRRVAVTFIKGVRFHNRAVRHLSLEGFHHIARQDIRAVAFARMELDAHTAGDVVIHQVIELDQMLSIDLSREINLGRMFVSLGGRNPLDANNRSLFERLCGSFHRVERTDSGAN